MEIFNYVLFALLTVCSLYLLFNRNMCLLKQAFNNQEKTFYVDNFQYLLLFILATAILACGSMMANRLLVCIILSFLVVILNRRPLPINLLSFFYVLYLAWLVVAFFYSPVKMYGFRVFLKYLYPFLIVLFASKVTYSAEYYLKALQVILYVAIYGLCSFLVLDRLPVAGNFFTSVNFWGPAVLDFFPVAITISLVLYSYSRQWKYLIFAVSFFIPSLIFTNRTGLLAASITICLFAIIRYRLKSILYVILGIGIFIGTVLYVPSFRDKMFKKQLTAQQVIESADELNKEDINSSARFAMWEWSLAQYYKGHEWKGSGLGVLQARFYSLNHPFETLQVVHNDYVQILCDTGLIGLILYGSSVLSLIVFSFYLYYQKKQDPVVRLAAIISGVSLAGMLPTLYTDNVVNYSLMTLAYPFALYGMTLGLYQCHKNKI